jgi:predicted secreted Zn-dependent protease
MKAANISVILGSALLANQALPACAQPTSHTTYSYFPVHGSSLTELHRDMASHEPSANGVRGYGVTSAKPGKQLSVEACKRNGDYRFGIEFVIQLPRAANPAALSDAERGLWNRFAQFVKKHEEVHRSIWMNCAVAFDRKLQASAAQNCAAGQARVTALWNQMLATCGPKQIAFDAAQRGALKAHPFMIRVAQKMPYRG